MCGAPIDFGLEPTHPVMYVLLAGCMFLIVFSAMGGGSHLFESRHHDNGYTTQVKSPQRMRSVRVSIFSAGFRASGLQIHPIPIILGLMSISATWRLMNTSFTVPQQISFGVAVLFAAWGLYLLTLYYGG
jgi:predicted permease